MLVEWFRGESAGHGKACRFSGFDYRGFKSLFHTYTQTDKDTRIYKVKRRHTLSSETEAGLNYSHPHREYLLKNGGVVGKGQFLLLKIPKLKTAGPACTVITQENREKV